MKKTVNRKRKADDSQPSAEVWRGPSLVVPPSTIPSGRGRQRRRPLRGRGQQPRRDWAHSPNERNRLGDGALRAPVHVDHAARPDAHP
jgi:hypothetical protein